MIEELLLHTPLNKKDRFFRKWLAFVPYFGVLGERGIIGCLEVGAIMLYTSLWAWMFKGFCDYPLGLILLDRSLLL